MFFLTLTIAFLIPSVLSLWPAPRSLKSGNNFLRLASNFDITLNIPSPPSDLVAAVARTKSYLQNDKLQRLVVGRGSADADAVGNATQLTTLAVSLTAGGPPTQSITFEAQKSLTTRDESYALTVPSNGSASVLKANTTLGLLRGLTTFTQLWYDSTAGTYMIGAPLEIIDAPAFPYRGFMLDTARNFFPVY